jgi:hypothetical protein
VRSSLRGWVGVSIDWTLPARRRRWLASIVRVDASVIVADEWLN